MTVKINLTIDEKTAKRIKSYAARTKTSVSKIAEEQFSKILNTDKGDKGFDKLIKKFAGAIKRKGPIDIKKEKVANLQKKYGL